MFTGLVEGTGLVADLQPEGDHALRLCIDVSGVFDEPGSLGESVALNGCCLTVVAADRRIWQFQAGSETLSRTNLGTLSRGDRINLERALKADARLGGHFVTGHIDGAAEIARIDHEGEWVHMRFLVSPELSRLMIPKGSVAIDGVSLTLVDVAETEFSVALIPHTLAVTTLGLRRVGDRVNIETDMLGKYVLKLMQGTQTHLLSLPGTPNV